MDFKIFTGALKAYQSPDGRKRISTIASSTVTDHYGDEMTPECVQGMAVSAAKSGMTIFLNHSYQVPEDVFGRTATAQARQSGIDEKTGAPVWDLELDVEVDETNPRAVQTYRSLRGPKDDGDGQKLGVSIGALIKDYELKDARDPFSVMRIKNVELLEASIVGIPANPRSWVKSAVRAYKASLKTAPVEKVTWTSRNEDVTGIGENLDRYVATLDLDADDPDDLPEGPVLPEVTRAASDNDDDDGPTQDQQGDHQHPHAHSHDHEHSHGYGDNETVHSHDHTHSHSHMHGPDHEHENAPDDYQHDHYHDDSQGGHAHESSADGLIVPDAPVISETDQSITPAPEQPAPEAKLGLAEEMPESTRSEAEEVIERAVDEAIDTLSVLVREQRQSLSERDAQILRLTGERDEALASLRLAMTFVEKLARTPLGKRTSFAAPISDFREKFAGVYDEEFLAFLKEQS